MPHTDVVIIGGSQAGLAMSHCLTARGIAHVVLERGRIGERWSKASWDSLRLLTPNWMTRLPGHVYAGPDPDGFMAAGEVVDLLRSYARGFGAPVETETCVSRVEPDGDGYRVTTGRGVWLARKVVIATGSTEVPFVPEMSRRLSPAFHQLASAQYRNPDMLPPGGVLVVGASASGVQLAEEIHASGRPVTLAVGGHTRLPRRYRGRDIFWWLDRIGALDERADDVVDIAAARRQPSLQLIGDPDHRSLDLGTLRAAGVKVVGRLADLGGTSAVFADDLVDCVRSAERRLRRMLARIDDFVLRHGLKDVVGEPVPPPALLFAPEPATLDLARAGIRTVLWATGFRRQYPWLRLRVLDPQGELIHRGGITPSPGLYAVGLRFMRRRNSSFIDGCGQDATALAAHIAASLERGGRLAA